MSSQGLCPNAQEFHKIKATKKISVWMGEGIIKSHPSHLRSYWQLVAAEGRRNQFSSGMDFLKATHVPEGGPRPKHMQVARSKLGGCKTDNSHMNLGGESVGKGYGKSEGRDGEWVDHNTLQTHEIHKPKCTEVSGTEKNLSLDIHLCPLLLSKCIDYHLHDKENFPMKQIR